MLYRRQFEDKEIVRYDMPVLTDIKIVRSEVDTLSLRQNTEKIERDAYENGFEAGERAGFSMGEQKAQVLIDRLDKIIEQLTELREKVIKDLEPQVVELAVSIAKKVLMKELTTAPEQIVELTKEAMMKIERMGQITIKINPSLYELFMRSKPEILNIHPDVIFDVDPSISRYGSVVMGPLEYVVTDVDEQIRNLIREMGDKLGSD